MDIKKSRLAFTLAEVMVVLLVLTIIFSAFAPIMTKRRTKSNKVDLWQWSSRNYYSGPMDSYYHNGKNIGSVFFGLTPNSYDEVAGLYKPRSKVIIRSGPVTSNNLIQRQLQLRYGRSDDNVNGDFAGTLLADTTNILFGGVYNNLFNKNIQINSNSYPKENVAIGYNALDNISNGASDNTAIGYNALNYLNIGKFNTAIGSSAGESISTGTKNVFVGSQAGISATGTANTIIGYSSQSGSGNNNTLVGALTGYNSSVYSFGFYTTGSNNVGIGYGVMGKLTTGHDNTAIGYNALKQLNIGNYNTAIGANACDNIIGESFKTCIGYNSGPQANSNAYRDLNLDNADGSSYTSTGDLSNNPNVQRTYIGSKPSNYFGGDSVLEIHNSKFSNSELNNFPSRKSNTTTVINGNLFVRGKTFFTIGSFLYPFNFNESNNLFTTYINKPCATNQLTYFYNDSFDDCSSLSTIFRNNVSQLSDRRLKNIGLKFDDGLDKLRNIRVYNYRFKSDPEKRIHMGVIAQELKSVFPNAVFKDNKGFFKIRKEELFYSAINALKELDVRIKSALASSINLEQKITELEKENEVLTSKVENLRQRVNTLKEKY